MRRSVYLSLFAFGVLILLPHLVHAAILQPIINAGGACNCTGGTNGSNIAPDWGCVLQTFQAVMNDFVVIATVVIVLFIAYSGFQFILSPTNAELRTKARSRIFNAVLGLCIVLAAFLLVNSLMSVLYNDSLGAWNSILGGSAETCIQSHAPPALPGLTAANNFGTGSGLTVSSPPGTSNPNPQGSSKINNRVAASTIDSKANGIDNYGGNCAVAVRTALAAGGLTDFNSNHPQYAYQYGSYLTNDGYTQVASNDTSGYTPQAGDVAVFQPIPGHSSGHIEMYDGSHWVSDTIQSGFLANQKYSNGSYAIYRG